MSTGPEHYSEAERLLNDTGEMRRSFSGSDPVVPMRMDATLAEAQLHAQLAAVAAFYDLAKALDALALRG